METRFLRTSERHCFQPDSQERGARYWSQVEILADTWFMVEGCIEEETGRRALRRYIVSQFPEALQLCRRGDFEWVRVHAYIRASTLFPNGHVFQTIEEAHQFGSEHAYLIRFDSALTVVVGIVPGDVGKPSLGKRVYPLQDCCPS